MSQMRKPFTSVDSFEAEYGALPPPLWKTEDGNILEVKDMKTSHIQNCIAKIKHHPKLWRSAFLPYLEAELEKRGIKQHGKT